MFYAFLIAVIQIFDAGLVLYLIQRGVWIASRLYARNDPQRWEPSERDCQVYRDSIIALDLEGTILTWNTGAERMFGWTAEEVLGRSYFELQPDASEGIKENIQRAVAGNILSNVEVRRCSKDGTTFDGILTVSPVRDREGDVVAIQGIIKDITERKRNEYRLLRLNETFLNLSSDFDENIKLLTEVCGEFLNATCALYSRITEGLLHSVGQWQTPEDFDPLDNPEGHICYDVIKRGKEGGIYIVRNLPETEYFQTDPNVAQYGLKTYVGHPVICFGQSVGSLCVVYQDDVELDESAERYMGILATAIGIEEERKRAEEELKQAHEGLKGAYERLEETQQQLIRSEKLASVGQLTAGISHEILNPLNIITLSLQLMIEDSDTSVEMASQLRILKEQAERIDKITQNLLYFSRQREPERRRIDLSEIAKQTILLLESDLRLRDIDVELRLTEELLPILADENQLQQVILNLLTNARDAMPEGGRLILSTKVVECYGQCFVELRVEDTGEGIAPEHINKLFDPFFTTKAVGEGTGLGLSICHGIIESHGGSIRSENISGGGAAFIVRLACIVEGKEGKKVLVVDDDPTFCEIMRKFLEGRGYMVAEAYDSHQALVLYSQARPNVVLLDVRMPGKDGLQVLRELKAVDPTANIIMLTAVQDQELAHRAKAAGAAKYITKPINLDYLDTTIATAMGIIGVDA